jgi:Fe-S cluster assembly protein SufD
MTALETLRQNSLKAYHDLPEPNSKDPAWRFATTRNYRLEDPFPKKEEEEDILNHLQQKSKSFLPKTSAQVTLVANNQLAALENFHPELGIALTNDIFKPAPTLGADKFQALNIALCKQALEIEIPANTEIEHPILITHWATSGNAYPQIRIIAQANSKATVIELYLNADEEEATRNNSASRIHGLPGSNLTRLAVHHRNPLSTDIHLEHFRLERDAVLNNHNLILGSLNMRQETTLTIAGSGVDSHLNSLAIASQDQEIDQRTRQLHLAPHSHSRLLFKNALQDNARTIFSGMIEVAKDAQNTDAFQTNRNLLLDDTAEANSLPGLEILANDVKCSHGATTGQIDPEQLYYMRTRGISQKLARKLLVYGFFEEILESIPPCEILNEQIRKWIEKQFHD